MTPQFALVFVFAAAVLLMGGAWLYQHVRKDAGVVDVGWTAGLAVAAVTFLFVDGGWLPRKLLVAGLVGFWSVRLCAYILKDRVIGKSEDRRYQRLRALWGAKASRNFFWVFEGETLLVVLFAVPFLAVMLNPAPEWTGFDLLGVIIWLVSIGGEWLSDRQLAAFRADPSTKGTTCRRGLWNYSRHPNYFFEWLHWWSYVVMAVGTPWFWWTLTGPAAMWLFIMYITGIPHVERQALSSRPDYREYQKTTNRLIPWFPRKTR